MVPSPTSMNPVAHPLSPCETKVAARNGKRTISGRSYEKK